MTALDTTTFEEDLVGAALSDRRLTRTVKIDGVEFTQPMLGAAWDAIRDLPDSVKFPTPPMIAAAATGIRVDPARLVDLVGRGFAADAGLYADRIQDAHRRRMLTTAAQQAVQSLREGSGYDEIVGHLTGAMSESSAVVEDVEATFTLDEFVDQTLPDQEWVIPGLLAAGERIVVTGEEGLGKSILIRQIAICVAAGYDPFEYADIPAKRVLFVDAENPLRIMVARLREIRDVLQRRGHSTEDRFWVHRYPQGLDLNTAAGRLTLHNLCRVFRPDLLCIGPVYKLALDNGQKDDAQARAITDTIDSLREQFGCAVILEHHSPHGQGETRSVRPFGSSVWRRWPEFGFGLMAERDSGPGRRAKLQHWRGARDERPWPKFVETVDGDRCLPWNEYPIPATRRTT